MPATTKSESTSQHAFSRKVARLGAASSRAGEALSAADSSAVRQGLPYEDLESLSEVLGLTQEMLTRVLGTSERTLQRRRRSGHLSPAESDRLWRIAHVWRLALEAFDGRAEEACQWLSTSKRALEGDTPVEHLDTEPGERAVEQMLAVIEHTMPA